MGNAVKRFVVASGIDGRENEGSSVNWGNRNVARGISSVLDLNNMLFCSSQGPDAPEIRCE